MAFKSGKFTYQPLQESMDFRLLELLPGERHETIKCSLVHSSLTSRPLYYAASYTWGTPGLFQEIELNGFTQSIQANLFDFLQELRLRNAVVTLWVDALCINQSDIVEKSIQVALMGLIYSSAKSVVVWLGPQADGSEEYFDSCNQISSGLQPPRSSIFKNADSITGSPTSAAIASLQRRTYWTRTWIIQELALASDIRVFCGDRSSHWPNFILHMPDQDTGNRATGMRYSTPTLSKLKMLRIIATRLTLRQLLFQCHMSRCSEPRDLIFSLLNIAKDTKDNPNSIVPDYSCTLETLFLQSMGCCPLPQIAHDGISCLQFCDTLSTRLEVDLERALACAREIVQFSPTSNLAAKLTSRSYFAKLTRFGRLVPQLPAGDENSPQNSVSLQAKRTTEHPLVRYTILEIPATITLHHMWSFDIPEATDTVFILNFESPVNPTQHLACICRPIHLDADAYGVIKYRVIGLGAIPQQFHDKDFEREQHMQATLPFLRSDLHSLHGRVVSGSIPGCGLEVDLLELITLCMYARIAGSFVRWIYNG